MKFTKFIPLALMLTLAVPAFATPSSSTSAEPDVLNFTLNPFFNITKNAQTLNGAVNPNDAYTELTVTTPMSFGYHVVSNNRADGVDMRVVATSQGGADTCAIGGTPEAPIIVFTNNSVTGTALPTAEQVGYAASSSSVKSNTPNAIAFVLTPTVAKVADTGVTTTAPAPAWNGAGNAKVLRYTFDNGEYNFDYSINEAVNATFSTYDTEGTYRATVTMTQATL